ncbi:type II toxin-antitoxin system PemK/MazF family toxin [Kaistia dalseonensis]|uniref:mRNA interferase MazF n=1 Tax=Kaistia dalseonensis TaxID=410840 RepID=A0ABU0HET5_9HYPH|nr:type II toxin-antitoxin system PemK/MazF family toxin [Kaistia dalseonensis]MCX5497382.1 type II toxin-antitoxin system PemK/MazF family toxin [Kaistia dalseonensis]MDQ0440021.1 mRNA interferase MazF [Kaistia dalseonensis]
MSRGEVWTVAGGPDYASKPRPVVILQSDAFAAIDSVTICPITSNLADAAFVRLLIEPSAENGLRTPSDLMVDKITTVPRSKLGKRIGRLGENEMKRLGEAVVEFLALSI